MNPRETDPGPGIPGSHLMSISTLDDKGEIRHLGTGVGGGEADLRVFGELPGVADLQKPAAPPDG